MVVTFVQTHRAYNTKSEHYYNIRTLSGGTRYMGTLYFPLHFAMKLKLVQTIKSIKSKKAQGHLYSWENVVP